MKLFLQKKCKIFEAPRPPCLRRLGALPPTPQPPAAGGAAPDPQNSPHCKFLATRLGGGESLSKNGTIDGYVY